MERKNISVGNETLSLIDGKQVERELSTKLTDKKMVIKTFGNIDEFKEWNDNLGTFSVIDIAKWDVNKRKLGDIIYTNKMELYKVGLKSELDEAFIISLYYRFVK